MGIGQHQVQVLRSIVSVDKRVLWLVFPVLEIPALGLIAYSWLGVTSNWQFPYLASLWGALIIPVVMGALAVLSLRGIRRVVFPLLLGLVAVYQLVTWQFGEAISYMFDFQVVSYVYFVDRPMHTLATIIGAAVVLVLSLSARNNSGFKSREKENMQKTV